MPSRTPLAWAVSPASARPSVSASSRSKPSRSATTAAHSVSTGARFTRIGARGPAMASSFIRLSNDIRNPTAGDIENPATPVTLTPRPEPAPCRP